VHITQGDLLGKAVIASWVTQSINLHLRCGMASNRATIIGEGGQNHPIQVVQLHIWIYPSCHIGQLAGMLLHFDVPHIRDSLCSLSLCTVLAYALVNASF
jgi:hypothetical protein